MHICTCYLFVIEMKHEYCGGKQKLFFWKIQCHWAMSKIKEIIRHNGFYETKGRYRILEFPGHIGYIVPYASIIYCQNKSTRAYVYHVLYCHKKPIPPNCKDKQGASTLLDQPSIPVSNFD
ncbi:hypothetical protein ACOSQ4_006323 [Xanthoceras sorbifolium]